MRARRKGRPLVNPPRFSAFYFMNGAAVTHLLAWDRRQRRWRVVCGRTPPHPALAARRVTYEPTLPLCQTCQSVSDQAAAVKADR